MFNKNDDELLVLITLKDFDEWFCDGEFIYDECEEEDVVFVIVKFSINCEDKYDVEWICEDYHLEGNKKCGRNSPFVNYCMENEYDSDDGMESDSDYDSECDTHSN